MAFSKAKFLRFNEISNCVPPPGAYTPKFDNHVAGAVVYTKDNKSESPATSISDSFASGRSFRIPRRKMISLSSSKDKLHLKTNLFTSPVKSEALREKIVECTNKDETIKDLELQIEELKFTICALRVDKSELTKDRDELITKLKDVEENLRQLLNNSKTDNQSISEILNLLQERLKINLDETQSTLKETEEKLADTEAKSCNLSKELSKIRDEYNELEKKYEESLSTCTNIQKNHDSEMESFQKIQQSKIDKLEKNITDVRRECQETVKKIEADHVNNISELKDTHDAELIQLKECFSCEKQKLENKSDEYITALSKLLKDLEITRNQLYVEVELRELDLKNSSEAQYRYEITLNKTYATVNALKNRLLNSDRDVEQLNKEIEQLEFSKVEIESKYSETKEKLEELVNERDTLKANNEVLLEIHEKVVTLKNDFLKKIDTLTSIADQKIEKLNTELTDAKTELYSFLNDQQKTNTDAEKLISNLQTKLTISNEKVVTLEETLEIKNQATITQEEIISEQNSQIHDLKDKLKDREYELNEITSVYKKLIDRSKDYDDLQQKHEELLQTCSALEKTVTDQNSLIGPFREQLKNYERECQLLLVDKYEAEKEAKEIGLRYAQMLGHQNHKQKIKHIVDLKKKNQELLENKNKCEAKLLQQKRLIDKMNLKIAQLTKLPMSDKENISNPLRMLNSPLKERN